MTGDIQIFGGVGRERNEISFDNVKAQLDQVKNATDIALHIWTPGGDVMEGEAIYNLLKNSGKPVTTYIEGTCASIGSLIALAGDKIVMNETGRFMIHNPKISGLNTQADARDLQHIAMQLNKIKTLLIDVSAKKTGLAKEKLWELYDNETWLTSTEAKEMGFVDEIIPDKLRAVATVDVKHFHMNQTILSRIDGKIKAIMNFLRFKNEFVEPLSDGTTIVVMSEDEDWTNKPVMYEDGSPVPDGDYTLASGKTITVAGGVISQVTEAAPANEEQKEPSAEDMKQIEELKAQIAELTAAKEAAEAALNQSQSQEAQAKAKSLKIENKLSQLEKDFMQLKEETSKTIGDTSLPGKGPVIKNTAKDQPRDEMGEFALRYFKQRNVIENED